MAPFYTFSVYASLLFFSFPFRRLLCCLLLIEETIGKRPNSQNQTVVWVLYELAYRKSPLALRRPLFCTFNGQETTLTLFSA